MKAARLLSERFLLAHPDLAVPCLERYPADVVVALLEHLPARDLAGLLTASLPVSAAGYLGEMDPARAAECVLALAPPCAVQVFRHIHEAPRNAILRCLPKETAGGFRRLLRYPQNTVGSMMNPFAFVLPEDITVAEALRRVRAPGRAVFYFPYIVNRRQQLVGILTVRELMLASPRALLSTVMRPDVVHLPASATAKAFIALKGWRAYQSLPVVDEHDVFSGVVTLDAMRELAGDLAALDDQNTVASSLLSLGASYLDCLAPLALAMAETATNTLTLFSKEAARHALEQHDA
jgi:magnesium transporter